MSAADLLAGGIHAANLLSLNARRVARESLRSAVVRASRNASRARLPAARARLPAARARLRSAVVRASRNARLRARRPAARLRARLPAARAHIPAAARASLPAASVSLLHVALRRAVQLQQAARREGSRDGSLSRPVVVVHASYLKTFLRE